MAEPTKYWTKIEQRNNLVQVDSNWFQADTADKEVVAFVTNHATTKVTCTIAFDGGNQWSITAREPTTLAASRGAVLRTGRES